MKTKERVLRDLTNEISDVLNKIDKIFDLKHNRTEEYIKLGSKQMQLLDVQEAILKSYYEILNARILEVELSHDDI